MLKQTQDPDLLTDEQIAFYEENGFLKVDEMLTAEELEDLRDSVEQARRMKLDKAMDEVARNNDESYGKILQVHRLNLWRDHEGIMRFVFNPRLAEMARRLTRSNGIRLFHDHLMIKTGESGESRPTPWHQDLPYFPMQQAGALSCWMALDDVDEDNGTLCFLPGSHKLPRFKGQGGIERVTTEDIYRAFPELESTEPYVVRMNAGSCTFHNANLFHLGTANRSNRERRAMIIVYMPDGTTHDDKGDPLTKPLGFKEGDPIVGEIFPILSEDSGA